MLSRSNFSLYAAAQYLDITTYLASETDNEDNSILAADAKRVSYRFDKGVFEEHTRNRYPNDDYYFGYKVENDFERELYCVFIGGLPVTECRIEILIGTTIVASSAQVDDYLFVKLPPGFREDEFYIDVHFPEFVDDELGNQEPNVRGLNGWEVFQPPFIGWQDLGVDNNLKYSIGAVDTFGQLPSFKETGDQSFSIVATSFKQKKITLNRTSEDQRDSIKDFFNNGLGNLSLMVVEGGKRKHDFYLGQSWAISSSQGAAGSSIDINIRDKFK